MKVKVHVRAGSVKARQFFDGPGPDLVIRSGPSSSGNHEVKEGVSMKIKIHVRGGLDSSKAR